MFSRHLSGRSRSAAFAAFTSLIAASSVAQAQEGAYGPPPGPDDPTGAYAGARAPYPEDGYGPPGYQGRNDPGSYGQGPYGQGSYGQGPYGQGGPDYNPYDAQRRAWAMRQWRLHQQQAAYAAYAMPAPDAPQAAPPPPPPPPPPEAGDPTARPTADIGAPAALPAVGSAQGQAPVASAGPPAPPQTAKAALAPQIVQSASAYLGYMRAAAALSPAFTDGEGVAREVRAGAAYEPKQFQEGAIAYAAIVALQEPAFVQGVLAAAGGDPARAHAIAAGLITDPDSARGFSGADAASARASAALRRQGDALMGAGLKMKQEAYDVQHAAWSKSNVPSPEVGLATAKSLSATRLAPTQDETGSLLKLALAEQAAVFPLGEGASSPVLRRGLALAALAVLGQAGEDNVQGAMSLMADPGAGECLSMAKLNLFQCLAVAGPHYEDIFCLGQHAMIDTAQCVIKASGAAHPATTVAAATQAPAVTAAPQDYWVPMAGAQMAAAAGERAVP